MPNDLAGGVKTDSSSPNISNTPHIVERLKACAHCGFSGSDYVGLTHVQTYGQNDHRIRCGQCRATTGPQLTHEAAIAAWNLRTPDPVITAYEAALKRIVETPNDGWVIAGAALAAQGRPTP